MYEINILYKQNPNIISLIGNKTAMIQLYNKILSAKKENLEILSIISENEELITITPKEIIHMSLHR